MCRSRYREKATTAVRSRSSLTTATDSTTAAVTALHRGTAITRWRDFADRLPQQFAELVDSVCQLADPALTGEVATPALGPPNARVDS